MIVKLSFIDTRERFWFLHRNIKSTTDGRSAESAGLRYFVSVDAKNCDDDENITVVASGQ